MFSTIQPIPSPCPSPERGDNSFMFYIPSKFPASTCKAFCSALSALDSADCNPELSHVLEMFAPLCDGIYERTFSDEFLSLVFIVEFCDGM